MLSISAVKVILSFGANQEGQSSTPIENIRRVIKALRGYGIILRMCSRIYVTAPVGPGIQSKYFNMVGAFDAPHTPAQLLRLLKQLEAEAGRRRLGINRPRPLDIDIIQYSNFTIGWQGRVFRRSRCGTSCRNLAPARSRLRRAKSPARAWLTLPHPLAHQRRFVLQPLRDVAPHWRHPVLGCTISQLIARLPNPPDSIVRLDQPLAEFEPATVSPCAAVSVVRKDSQ